MSSVVSQWRRSFFWNRSTVTCRADASGTFRFLRLAAGIFAGAALVAACGGPTANADTPIATPQKESVVQQDAAPQDPAVQDLITLTGTRLTMGNAVDCPTLRDAAGVVHGLSYLSPAVVLGARVTVTGVYGISTRCRGTVLVVQQETILPD